MSHSPDAPVTRSAGWRFFLLSSIVLGLFLLCASVVVAAVRKSRDAPTLVVQAERTMQGAKISLRGEAWPPRTELTFSGSTPPGATAKLDLGTTMTNAEGAFRATKLSACTTRTAPDAKATVTITASAGALSVEATLPAAHWECMATR